MNRNLILLAIVTVGIVLRVLAVGLPDPNVDEAIALYFAKFDFFDLWQQLYRAEVHPWGFYTLLHLWQKIVGFNLLGVTKSSLVAVWALGSLGYALNAAAIHRLAKEWRISFRAEVVLQFTIATSLFFIDLAKQLRTYPWLMLFLVLSLTAAHRSLRTGKKRAAMEWAVASALAFAFHYYAVLPILGQALFLVVYWKQNSYSRRTAAIAGGLCAALCLPTALLMVNPTKLMNLQPLSYAKIFTPSTLFDFIGDIFAPSFPRIAHPGYFIWLSAVISISLFVLFFIRNPKLQMASRLLVCSSAPSFALLVLVGMMGLPLFLPRYFSFLALNLVLGFAIVVELELEAKAVRYRQYLVVGISVILVFNAAFLARHSISRIQVVRGDWSAPEVALPSARLRALESFAKPQSLKVPLCRGEAVFSDDYAAAEFLLHFCPKNFARLSRLNTQIFLPSTQWRRLDLPPQLIVFHASVPSRELFSNEWGFFEYASLATIDHYSQFATAEYQFYLRRPVPRQRRSAPKSEPSAEIILIPAKPPSPLPPARVPLQYIPRRHLPTTDRTVFHPR